VGGNFIPLPIGTDVPRFHGPYIAILCSNLEVDIMLLPTFPDNTGKVVQRLSLGVGKQQFCVWVERVEVLHVLTAHNSTNCNEYRPCSAGLVLCNTIVVYLTWPSHASAWLFILI